MVAAGEDVATIVDLMPGPSGVGAAASATRSRSGPPSGAVVAAWADDATVERWLDAGAPPASVRQSYLDMLDAVRLRGYAVELTGTVDARIYEALAQVGGRFGDPGPDPSSQRLRSLLDALIGEVGGPEGFHPVSIEPVARYQIGTMSAPVFDHRGEVVLLLAVRGPVEEVDGRTVDGYGRRLVEAADEVTDLSGGRRPVNAAAPRSVA